MTNTNKASLSKEQLLALKTVVYGCNTNHKLSAPHTSYCVFNEDGTVKEEMEFVDALKIMYELIDEMEIDNAN